MYDVPRYTSGTNASQLKPYSCFDVLIHTDSTAGWLTDRSSLPFGSPRVHNPTTNKCSSSTQLVICWKTPSAPVGYICTVPSDVATYTSERTTKQIVGPSTTSSLKSEGHFGRATGRRNSPKKVTSRLSTVYNHSVVVSLAQPRKGFCQHSRNCR